MSREVADRFAANLSGLRKRAEITQEELAFRASLHRTEIGLLERGARLPPIDTLAKLAGALEIEPEAFFDGITWTPGDFRPASSSPTRTLRSEHGQAV